MSGFVKAERSAAKLRMALVGPSGSGKTMSALKIGQGLGERIAVIDTEHGSASKYAGDVADFDVMELSSYHPDRFIEGIQAAAKAGYQVLIIDSLSHAWAGEGGVLSQVDQIAARQQSKGNTFGAWREATPLHNKLINAILAAPMHVICTMRAKTEYVLEANDRGKQVPRKVGLAPVQRDGMEYEFDVVGDIDTDHRLVVSKSRYTPLADRVIERPGMELGQELGGWLGSGVEDAQMVKARNVCTDLITDLTDRGYEQACTGCSRMPTRHRTPPQWPQNRLRRRSRPNQAGRWGQRRQPGYTKPWRPCSRARRMKA
jgi:AAA domain